MVKHRSQLDTVPQIRCAIYTRKSVTEGLEQEFNSLDAQREAAEAYIRSQSGEGWVLLPDVYSDGGFSGGNIERPGVQQLLKAVERGEIDCIVVYKVDRLSRSLLDFARIMEILERHNCSFVSVTQQFNTTNSMGRLTLNILLSFAQFEREIIAERTRDKIVAARRKGKWTGGCPVLGYDIGPDKRLLVNPEEALVVKGLFTLFTRHESLLSVQKECRERGWKSKIWRTNQGRQIGGCEFNKARLYNLLTNPIYAGKVRSGDAIYEGEHEPIITEELFDRTRAIFERNRNDSGTTVRNRHGALLKGLLFDARTGYALGHTFTKKGNKLYRYYVNTQAQKSGWESCATTSVPAAEIESFVVEQIRAIGKDRGLQEAVHTEATREQEERIRKIETERQQVFRELERLGESMRDAAGGDGIGLLSSLREQSARCEERLSRLISIRKELETETLAGDQIRQAMEDFDPCWNQMVPRERTRLLELMIEKILVDGEKGKIAIKFRPCGIGALLKGGL